MEVIRNIEIHASQEEVEKIQQTFEIFEKNNPKLFSVWQTMKAVIVLQEDGYENFIYYDLKVFLLKTATVLEMEPHFLASLFVHEAQHLLQYANNPDEFDDYDRAKQYYEKHERDAYEAQQKFLKKVGTQDDCDWLQEQFEKKWWVDTSQKKEGENIAFRDGDYYRKIAEKYI